MSLDLSSWKYVFEDKKLRKSSGTGERSGMVCGLSQLSPQSEVCAISLVSLLINAFPLSAFQGSQPPRPFLSTSPYS